MQMKIKLISDKTKVSDNSQKPSDVLQKIIMKLILMINQKNKLIQNLIKMK